MNKPGDKAKNESHRGPFNKGAAIKTTHVLNRREPRGDFGNNPNGHPIRGRQKHTAFDAQGTPRIPYSKIQKAA